MTVQIDRRGILGATVLGGAVMALPSMAFAAAATNKRFVFVIQRGAADGLSIVPATGDPAFAGLRGSLIDRDATRLDAMFSLHPALSQVAALFAKGEARAYHAVATAYRDRSHFDGQNVLESGAGRPYSSQTGWLGRLLPLLPASERDALALAPAIPLALRGSVPVATYAPNRLPEATDDLLVRVGALYDEDAQFAPLWAEAMKTRVLTGDISGNSGANGADLGKLAASLLAPDDGARVMMVETGGWDTHGNQRARLIAQLKGLDGLVGELKKGLGPAWRDTLVLVATEFGRTAAVNGTNGTDHGTASAALLLGGGLPKGEKVVSDWPGLAQSSLLDGRDLRPTMRLGDVVADALAAHYDLDRTRLAALFA